MSLCFFSTALSPAPVQATGLPTYDAGNFLRSAAEFIYKVYQWIRENLLDTITAVTYKNGMALFINQLATQTAEWIASGGEGNKPLIFTAQWGDYLQDAKDGATANLVLDFADSAGLGDLCLSPDFALDIALPQLEAPKGFGEGGGRGGAGGGAECSLDELSKSWDVRDSNFLKNFSKSFSPDQNDLGIAVGFLAKTQAEKEKEEKEAEKTREDSGGYQSVESGVSEQIQTPQSQVESKMTETSGKTSDIVTAYTGDLVADAISAFTTTLASQYLEKLQSGFFSFANDFMGGGGR